MTGPTPWRDAPAASSLHQVCAAVAALQRALPHLADADLARLGLRRVTPAEAARGIDDALDRRAAAGAARVVLSGAAESQLAPVAVEMDYTPPADPPRYGLDALAAVAPGMVLNLFVGEQASEAADADEPAAVVEARP